jgi:hypothetical protein
MWRRLESTSSSWRHRLREAGEALFGKRPLLEAQDTLWITARNQGVHIGNMTRSHLVHTLALIMRVAAKGHIWQRRHPWAGLRYVPRDHLAEHLAATLRESQILDHHL